jgi:hypothetical protein
MRTFISCTFNETMLGLSYQGGRDGWDMEEMRNVHGVATEFPK